jgi:hypothetical protein
MKTLQFYDCRRRQKRLFSKRILRVSVLMIVSLMFMCMAISQTGAVSGESVQSREVVVSRGDTLWSLARLHLPGGLDVRDYLDMIIAENALKEVIIYPGQVIRLP